MSMLSPPDRSDSPDPEERLEIILKTMREISSLTDPQVVVRAYATRMERIVERDRLVTLSRRNHEYPEVRVTRDSQGTEDINPWTQRERLPVLKGGILAELIYSDAPHIIDHLDVPDDDPGARYFQGYQSLMAVPLFDGGVAKNMVLLLKKQPKGFPRDELAQVVWISNLFGRMTHNLVLSRELREAYEAVDRELEAVANIQRALLPKELPDIPTLDLAVHYETSRRAGGDYYDFFPLAGGRWGILMADVSGHGTPAAVMMAITHTLAHTHPDEPYPPGQLLTRLNQQLVENYTSDSGTFVTAFYGVYDPPTRALVYSNAGHNPPRIKRCATGQLDVLDGTASLPLGIAEGEEYPAVSRTLMPGDQIVFYTDGITEAFNTQGEMFGTQRMDQAIKGCRETAQGLIDSLLSTLADFTGEHPARRRPHGPDCEGQLTQPRRLNDGDKVDPGRN